MTQITLNKTDKAMGRKIANPLANMSNNKWILSVSSRVDFSLCLIFLFSTANK